MNCSFCEAPATTHVEDENDIMPACSACADAWSKDPGFHRTTPTPSTAEPTDVEQRAPVFNPPEIYVIFSEGGAHIRQWATKPFEGAKRFTSLPSEREQIVARLRIRASQYEHAQASNFGNRTCLYRAAALRDEADQIEAGAHLPTTEQEEG